MQSKTVFSSTMYSCDTVYMCHRSTQNRRCVNVSREHSQQTLLSGDNMFMCHLDADNRLCSNVPLQRKQELVNDSAVFVCLQVDFSAGIDMVGEAVSTVNPDIGEFVKIMQNEK